MEIFPQFWGFLIPLVSVRQELVTDLAAWSPSKRARGKRGSILYLALSGWDCRPGLASMCKRSWWYISRSTPKGPGCPKGSNLVRFGRKKPDFFSAGPCNSFLFTHWCSLHSCSWWKTSEMVFPSEGRWIRRCLVLVQGCSQERFFLLVSLLVDSKEGTFPLCLLSEEVLLQMMVAYCSKFILSAVRWEVKPEVYLMGGYLVSSLLCAFSLQRECCRSFWKV